MLMSDSYIDSFIGVNLLEANKVEIEKHVSSGKLSAGMLGQPLQWQVLKYYEAPQKEYDEYTLRKFLRGKEIEKWLIEQIPNNILQEDGKQKEALYRNVIGFIDATVDTKDWNFPVGIIPLEIKSVSNAKYKRIIQSSQLDHSHTLQAALYALSEQKMHFAICYVATDDLRVKTYIQETASFKDEIDRIIDEYDEQMKTGTIPIFKAKEDWQASMKYNNYPDWMELTQEEINDKQQKLFEIIQSKYGKEK